MRVRSRHFLGKGTYVPYPHSNGFTADGKSLIVGVTNEDGTASLRGIDLDGSKSIDLPPLPGGKPNKGESAVWHDVALRAPVVAALCDNRAWTLDLTRDAEWRCVYAPDTSGSLQGLPSIAADGRRLLVGETRPGCHAAVEIDFGPRQPTAHDLFTKPWLANHFHYCPHDESWVGFSHEGPAETTLDRCWAWHPVEAPQGRMVFDQYQIASDPDRPLNAGHERWAFHDTSAYVVAYAVSPGGPRGLYEIFADARPARLLWENDTVWHCNMDASGRIAVIDTSAPWTPAGEDPNHGSGLERHLLADKESKPNASDVVILDLQSRSWLCAATVMRAKHPYHPHPAISPDGKWLVFNDADPAGKGAWLLGLEI